MPVAFSCYCGLRNTYGLFGRFLAIRYSAVAAACLGTQLLGLRAYVCEPFAICGCRPLLLRVADIEKKSFVRSNGDCEGRMRLSRGFLWRGLPQRKAVVWTTQYSSALYGTVIMSALCGVYVL